MPDFQSMPHTILVIDDDPLIREFVDLVLSQAGHRATTAASGESGLEALNHVHADLVLLDIHMPGMSGLDMLRVVRQHRRLRTPVVMMTARSDIGTVRLATREGADGFIVKPFTANNLVRRVNAVLRGDRAAPRPAPAVPPTPAAPSGKAAFEID